MPALSPSNTLENHLFVFGHPPFAAQVLGNAQILGTTAVGSPQSTVGGKTLNALLRTRAYSWVCLLEFSDDFGLSTVFRDGFWLEVQPQSGRFEPWQSQVVDLKPTTKPGIPTSQVEPIGSAPRNDNKLRYYRILLSTVDCRLSTASVSWE
jgi:hypothetical protein